MTSDAVSAKGIKAQMPHPILTCVFGEPTYKQVKTVIRKLSANLMAISCPWGHSKGHLGLLQDPAIYLVGGPVQVFLPICFFWRETLIFEPILKHKKLNRRATKEETIFDNPHQHIDYTRSSPPTDQSYYAMILMLIAIKW
jgi:hypothetical protein